MKKIITSCFITFLLFSGFTYAEDQMSSQSICKEAAKLESIEADAIKEFLEKCVKDIETEAESSSAEESK